ncbi:hypothetical protein GE061_013800 [Apolygus lucorum]|uniref:Uncharacterized protein n=1 Tax=Apolygus lucorum TaxID=248454 RepID=A0A8S9XP12_APOLU|nr:hypothetical protein GE061_013800 [Apolygus lucorum]
MFSRQKESTSERVVPTDAVTTDAAIVDRPNPNDPLSPEPIAFSHVASAACKCKCASDVSNDRQQDRHTLYASQNPARQGTQDRQSVTASPNPDYPGPQRSLSSVPSLIRLSYPPENSGMFFAGKHPQFGTNMSNSQAFLASQGPSGSAGSSGQPYDLDASRPANLEGNGLQAQDESCSESASDEFRGWGPPVVATPALLKRHLEEAKSPEEEVPYIHPSISDQLTTFMRSGLQLEYYKELTEKYRPRGPLGMFQPPKLDSMVKEAVPQWGIVRDDSSVRRQGIQAAALVASGAALSLLASDEVNMNDPSTREGVIDYLWHSTALQCACIFKASTERKRSLLTPFSDQFKELAMAADVGKEELFDGKAQAWIQQIQEGKRVSSQLIPKKQKLPPRKPPPAAQTNQKQASRHQDQGNFSCPAPRRNQPKEFYRGPKGSGPPSRRQDYNKPYHRRDQYSQKTAKLNRRRY